MLKFSVLLVKHKVAVPKPSKIIYLYTIIQLSSQAAHRCACDLICPGHCTNQDTYLPFLYIKIIASSPCI